MLQKPKTRVPSEYRHTASLQTTTKMNRKKNKNISFLMNSKLEATSAIGLLFLLFHFLLSRLHMHRLWLNVYKEQKTARACFLHAWKILYALIQSIFKFTWLFHSFTYYNLYYYPKTFVRAAIFEHSFSYKLFFILLLPLNLSFAFFDNVFLSNFIRKSNVQSLKYLFAWKWCQMKGESIDCHCHIKIIMCVIINLPIILI